MKKVYLDNAATTSVRPEVIAEMAAVLSSDYGNPSSAHSFGRSARNILELARKSIARHFNAQSAEIIFTSGATEANNWILFSAVRDLGVQRIISSKVEHHAVLHAIERLRQDFPVRVDYVPVFSDGSLDLKALELLLSEKIPTLVSLMHVNNETGVLLDLGAVSALCLENNAFFHTDTVQSIGKMPLDLQQIPLDFMVASAHKFHGPKGIGFAFVRKGHGLHPLFQGGEQEKGLRPGTESLHNVAGMALALDIAYERLAQESAHIAALKSYALARLQSVFPGTSVNGTGVLDLYNILNVQLPLPVEKTPMILFFLDMKGIAVSRGSACQSGSIRPSHVLAEMLDDQALLKPNLRLSFSHHNTESDIDALVDALKSL